MNIYKLSMCLLVALSLQVKADNHCYDYPDDADCKETTEVVDILDLFNGGSKTDNAKYPDGTLEVRNYSIFSDEGDHFKELAEQGKFLSASKLFNKYEDSYFYKETLLGGKTPVDKLQDEINKVASGLRARKNPMVLRKISLINDELLLLNSSNISLAPKWTHLSELIEDANQTYDNYKSIRIIELSSNQDNLSSKLHEKIKLLKQELKIIAPIEFDRFDFSTNRDFFKDYPVKLNKLEVIHSSSKTVMKWLNTSNLDEAIALIDKYNLNRSKAVRDKLAGILLDKASRATYGDKQPKFMDVVATLKQIQDLGIHIEPSALPTRYKTTFVVTNSTKDFDTLKDVLSKDEPYLVVIDKRKLDTQKSNGTLNKVHSKYISRRENVSNPDYVSEKRRYNNTLNAYNAAVQNHRNALQAQEERKRQYQIDQQTRQLNAGYSTNCTGYGNNINCSTSRNVVGFVPDFSIADIGPSIAQGNVGRAGSALSNAERRLSNIPREVEKLVYSDYSFATRTHEVIKNYDYNIYVINRVTGKYFLTNLPQESKQTFVVTKDLNSEDANYSSTDFQTLDDIEMFISNQDEHSIGDLMSKIPSEYSLVNYSDIKELINSIRDSYQEPVSNTMGEPQTDVNINSNVPQGSDYIKDLQRIKALLDSGIINQDDFETLKQKIIDKL